MKLVMNAKRGCFTFVLLMTAVGIISYLSSKSTISWKTFHSFLIFYTTSNTNWSKCSNENKESFSADITDPFNATVIHACGDFKDRIHLFNIALNNIRTTKIEKKKPFEWKLYPATQMQLLAEWTDNFLTTIGNYSQIKTVILPWVSSIENVPEDWNSISDSSNILIHKYYESVASEPLCTWIETPGEVGFGFDIINNWTCNRDIRLALNAKSLPLVAVNAKPPYNGYYSPVAFPEQFFRLTPRFVFSLYLIDYGIIDGVGDVYSDKVKIVPYTCFPDRTIKPPPSLENIKVYKEVFIISQSFGLQIYHRMIEVIPRIALYVNFMLRNPTIKIHAPEVNGYTLQLLKVLGFAEDRIVSGWVRGELIYLPRASMCCFANIPEIQQLSRLYRQYIETHFHNISRNQIIMIRRATYRRFKDQFAMEKILQQAATMYNLSFKVFTDNPVPTLNDTMRMFNSAVMVIGPHGAGLSNMVFCKPGTYIIEGVCNKPYAFLFFQRLALVLGHRWHGIPAKTGCTRQGNGSILGIVDVELATFNATVLAYLEQMSSLL